MQDRAQKALVLHYVVAKRWFPQLEMDVSTFITIAKTPTSVTDVDVYASVPDDFAGFRSVVADCKTRKGESPITRAMWQKGLMERLGADRGLCVLRTPRIEPDHRYTAARLGVTLLAESEFPAYAAATAVGYSSPLGAVADIDRWDAFFKLSNRFQGLEPAVKFSRSGFWMSENESEACTRTIFLASRVRPELDPAQPEHLAVVADLTALFTHALSRIVARIFAAYLQPSQQTDLSRALLYLLYGGRSSYDNLNRLKRLIAEPLKSGSSISGASATAADDHATLFDPQDRGMLAEPVPAASAASGVAPARKTGASTKGRVSAASSRDPSIKDLSLPEWDRFVELVRQMLDAPLEVSHSPMLLREIGWAAIGSGVAGSDGVTAFARTLSSESPQGARFAVLSLDYLCRAAKLPQEFADVLTSRLLTSQSKR